jgi:FlaA1/EpsC-like NDP-sugar epimerase
MLSIILAADPGGGVVGVRSAAVPSHPPVAMNGGADAKRRQTLVLLLLDLCVVVASGFGAIALRFDGIVPDRYLLTALMFVSLAIPIKLAVLWRFKLYRLHWDYVGTFDLVTVAKASLLSSAVLAAASFLVIRSPELLPRSIVVIDLLLGTVGFSAIRTWPRASRSLRGFRAAGERRVLVVGAGEAGASLVRDIKHSPSHRMKVMGIVDDDPAKDGTLIHGVEVLGGRSLLPLVLSTGQVDEVLIAMPSASGAVIQETVGMLRRAGVASIKIVPDLDAVLSGRVAASNVRSVRVEDLLNRTPPPLDVDALSSLLEGSTVLVTGAAGSIGSELCRHLARLPLARLVLLDQNESGIFDLQRELRRLPDAPDMEGAVGDIRDEVKVRRVFDELGPQVVFHAAAYKHVPLMELHPREAVRTNTLGTLLVASEAARTGARAFVLISTDKAVNPSSVMGATKRVAEMMVATLFREGSTRFITLRFGNVLGSRGSLIPVMEDQIRTGGPITITHPSMERFFMTSTEAVFLILNALAEGRNGDIMVLDMGEPINLLDLAHAVTRMSGLEPDVDIPIVFSGPRPGEKWREELVGTDERREPTRHPKMHRVISRGGIDAVALREGLALLREETAKADGAAVRRLLQELVPTYDPAGSVQIPQDLLLAGHPIPS